MPEPPVTIEAYHSSEGANFPLERVVIHATCPPRTPYPAASAPGQAAATASYFHQQSSAGSAHYVIDVAFEQHTLAEMLIGWHAPPNQFSVGIEICGQATYTRDEWLSPQVWPAVERAALRARDVCDRRGVPWVKLGKYELRAGARGVCGHVDVSEAWHESDHTDPGPAFPWDRFMLAGVRTQGEAMARFPNAVDACKAPGGGVWVLGSDGGVGAYGGAPFQGSYPALPKESRQGERGFLTIAPNDRGGYDLLADDGAAYSFPI